jgi:hypothetical protein
VPERSLFARYFEMYLKLIADRFALTEGFGLLRDELALGFSRAAEEVPGPALAAAPASVPGSSPHTTSRHPRDGARGS